MKIVTGKELAALVHPEQTKRKSLMACKKDNTYCKWQDTQPISNSRTRQEIFPDIKSST